MSAPMRLMMAECAPAIGQPWWKRAANQIADYYPNLRDRRFWAVQALVLAVAGIHDFVEVSGVLVLDPYHPFSLSFVPVALFVVPVGYAALNFGLSGSVATAIWCTLLVIPNFFMFHHGIERLAELLQLGIVDLVAIFVGHRVDREVAARRHAEAAAAALRASEQKYRGLFESSPLPVLIIDPHDCVLEANPAAGVLFGRQPDAVRGLRVAELVGLENARRLLERGHSRDADHFVLRRSDGNTSYLTTTFTELGGGKDSSALQVILADVTAEHERQAGLRAYAAHILKAQEEERKRIAQELHDDAVQRMILLCRKLDRAEEGNGNLPERTRAALCDAREAAELIVQDLRNYARALRPPILDDLGLVASIRRLQADLRERMPITTKLAIAGGERRLEPNVELALYRIAQEALSNVARHSQARRVTLLVEFGEDEVALRVMDDGVGFARGAADFAAGRQLGLLGMQERAEVLGGRLEIDSSALGTTVTVRIPDMANSGALAQYVSA